MEFDWIDGIGWRDGVLVAAAAIGIYLVLAVLRLFQVAGKRRAAGRAPVAPAPFAWQQDGAFASRPPVPATEAPPVEFARELARSNIELEVERLRREGVQLREELARLADEVARLRSTRNVSPLYNEAMTLAQQGMPASGIAGRCGISIGEAELVAAMARGAAEFEAQQQDGEDDERHNESGQRSLG
jgi:hypothetical protein